MDTKAPDKNTEKAVIKPTPEKQSVGNTSENLKFISGADILLIDGKRIKQGEEFKTDAKTAEKLLSSKNFKVEKK